MSHRTVAVATLAVLLGTGAPATAQDAQPGGGLPPDELFAGTCGALVPAVVPLQDAGRYLVTLRRRPGAPRLSVVLRLDDRTGHWLYPVATAPQVIVIVPGGVSPPLNLTAASTGGAAGTDTACELGGRPVSTAAPIAAPDVPVLTPSARVPDPQAACETPFASVRLSSRPTMPQFAAGTRQEGAVRVRIEVNPDGTVRDASVLAAPNAAMGAELVSAVRTLTFTPEVFRCTAMPSHTFYAVTLRRNPG